MGSYYSIPGTHNTIASDAGTHVLDNGGCRVNHLERSRGTPKIDSSP